MSLSSRQDRDDAPTAQECAAEEQERRDAERAATAALQRAAVAAWDGTDPYAATACDPLRHPFGCSDFRCRREAQVESEQEEHG